MVLLYACLFSAYIRSICCTNFAELVSSIALHEDRARVEGLEVCVVQVREYTDRSPMEHTMKSLMKHLQSTYPVTIARHQPFVPMQTRRDASLVLVDASGFGTKVKISAQQQHLYAGHNVPFHLRGKTSFQFPTDLVSRRLKLHECYSKASKFIVLVDGATNVTTGPADLFGALGIVNYLVVPLHVQARAAWWHGTEPLVGRLYTKNQYSQREYEYDIGEHQSSTVSRYFPDKLGNVHGYRFYVIGQFEFPYLIALWQKNRTAGLLVEALHRLIVRKLNGTMSVVSYTIVPGGRSEFDVTFALTNFRPHFMHDFTLMERGGSCLLCPFHTERDFLRHLLKPFSLGIWLVLGTVLVVCRLLGRLFPAEFQGNLVEMIFFGTGVPHRQPFPTRIVSFAVALLVFFLSEAYNAKIISLMSLAKYYERPETVQELNQSALLIANTYEPVTLLAEQLPGKVLSAKRASQIYREKGDAMFNEYCTLSQCHMAMLAASDVEGERGYKQYVMREHVLETMFTLQLATHSPFHQTFVEFLLRYFENGIWMYRVDGLRNQLASMVETMVAQFARVVFHFDDLFCVWVLIMVGWLLSLACFIGELLVAPLRETRAVRLGKCLRRKQ